MTTTQESITGVPGEYKLLHILTETPRDDRPELQHFVCADCLDLVESVAGSTFIHDCRAAPARSVRADDEETS
jgi:hypothetical protein